MDGKKVDVLREYIEDGFEGIRTLLSEIEKDANSSDERKRKFALALGGTVIKNIHDIFKANVTH